MVAPAEVEATEAGFPNLMAAAALAEPSAPRAALVAPQDWAGDTCRSSCRSP